MGAFEPITAELMEKLQAERERTGVGPTALLRGTASDPERPPTLKGIMITNWLSGTAKSARPGHIAYVLRRWESLPDATERSARSPAERVPLTGDILVVIDEFWDRGFLPDKLLERRNVPEGLNAAIIRTWKDRRIKTAAKDYLEFVLSACTRIR